MVNCPSAGELSFFWGGGGGLFFCLSGGELPNGFFVCPVVNCSAVNCLVFLLASGELSGGKMPTGELFEGEMPYTHLQLGLSVSLLHGPVQPTLQHNLNCPEHE